MDFMTFVDIEGVSQCHQHHLLLCPMYASDEVNVFETQKMANVQSIYVKVIYIDI